MSSSIADIVVVCSDKASFTCGRFASNGCWVLGKQRIFDSFDRIRGFKLESVMILRSIEPGQPPADPLEGRQKQEEGEEERRGPDPLTERLFGDDRPIRKFLVDSVKEPRSLVRQMHEAAGLFRERG
jgi:hypothetical protein